MMAYERYHQLLHAMQSGVAMVIQLGLSEDHTPKHLRVGVNSAMAEHSGLVKLLIAKGVITEEEVEASLTKAMEDEVALYEKQLSAHFGKKVTLG
jgi:hypothetical protein